MARIKTPMSRAFFLELVLAFAIFAATASICLQVFAQANNESTRSAAITEIGIKSQQVAEEFKAQGGDIETLRASSNAECLDNMLVWYYDEGLNQASADSAHFTLTCYIENFSEVKVATLALVEGERELFKYDVSKYPQAKVVR